MRAPSITRPARSVAGTSLTLAAVLVGLANPQARFAITTVAVASLALRVVSLWAAWIGVLVNLVILAASNLSRPAWRRL